jgi:hypothetical protein
MDWMMKREEDSRDVVARNKLLKERETMIEYLHLKVEIEDWHGVADAAMDLREIDVRLKMLDES